MATAAVIGVDWGTSNARFLLADGDGGLLEARDGPGVAQLASPDAIEAACFDAIGDWPRLPVVMAGMVGSNIGWRPAPYVRAPAAVADIAASAVRFVARGVEFLLLPGVETRRGDGTPDLMRGEETQIFGVMTPEDTLVCLPGTHVKWAKVAGGRITGFHTAMTGELLDLMARGSILLNPRRAASAQVGPVFLDAVAAIKTSALGLESMLFGVRSRQIAGMLDPSLADGYLAGLCVGADVRSALLLHPAASRVMLVGTPALTALYTAALSAFGVTSDTIDGRDAALAGLVRVWRATGR